MPKRRANREQHQRRGGQRADKAGCGRKQHRGELRQPGDPGCGEHRDVGVDREVAGPEGLQPQAAIAPTASFADWPQIMTSLGALARPNRRSRVRRRTAKRPSRPRWRWRRVRIWRPPPWAPAADRRRDEEQRPGNATSAPMPTSVRLRSGSARPESSDAKGDRQRQAGIVPDGPRRTPAISAVGSAAAMYARLRVGDRRQRRAGDDGRHPDADRDEATSATRNCTSAGTVTPRMPPSKWRQQKQQRGADERGLADSCQASIRRSWRPATVGRPASETARSRRSGRRWRRASATPKRADRKSPGVALPLRRK